ncbi:hypothetical protein V1264_013404 [Littorina saxatilis]|uniref:Uncharacterized protein n=1 Tax=Littorina saxatilis TaxID=31220 RepID=A0AAN9BQK5_9CAEN
MSELDVTWARYAQHVDLGVELDTACQSPRRHQHEHRLYLCGTAPASASCRHHTARALPVTGHCTDTHTHTMYHRININTHVPWNKKHRPTLLPTKLASLQQQTTV